MNNKGFAATGILYTLLMLFILLMMGIISMFYSRNNLLTKIKNDVKNEIQNIEIPVKIELSIGKEVYFDPVTTNPCNATTFNITNINSNSSTCYKWHVISFNDEMATIQLDHNLVLSASYVSNSDYFGVQNNSSNPRVIKGPITLLKYLYQNTSGWIRVEPLNYTYDSTAATYNYGALTCTNGICSCDGASCGTTLIGENVLRARVITAEEFTSLVNSNSNVSANALSKTWTLSSGNYYFSHINYLIGTNTKSNGNGNTDMSWLIQNTKDYADSGAQKGSYNTVSCFYWTLSPSLNQDQAWSVSCAGNFMLYNISSAIGIRPVIEINRSLLS